MSAIDTSRVSDNRLDVFSERGRSRVHRSLAVPPVRFVQPRIQGQSALVFVSALGGGLLEGDDYRFELNCGERANLMFAPQANTRVFPCPGGRITRQHISGTVYADGLAVSGGDPTVLYAGSRFSQSQRWIVHPGARLVLLDWLVAGRLNRGERFAFESYESDVRVEDPEGRPLLRDRLRLEPAKSDPAAALGGFGSHLALHVMGPGWEMLRDETQAWLTGNRGDRRPAWMAEGMLAGLGVREGVGFSLRALGTDRRALEPLAEFFFGLLGANAWLGFNFWARKY